LDNPAVREVVTTMATTLFGWRPSALPAVRASLAPTSTDVRLVRVAGIPALPTGLTYVAGVGTLHNSIGAPAAVPATAMAAEGAAMSALAPQSQWIDADQANTGKAKGFNARGNPPRGRRRV
jgi:hypothetical protein